MAPFEAPSWVPRLPPIPDNITIPEFIFNDKYRKVPLTDKDNFFTCGLTGKTYSGVQTRERVDLLARSFAKELGWSPNAGTEWDKVACLFAANTIDTNSIAWAIHRLGGVCTPANAAYSAFELEHQIKDSGAKAVITCALQLDITLEVTQKLGIPKSRIYLIDIPSVLTGGKPTPAGFKTIEQLISEGKSAPSIEAVRFSAGQGAKQCAFLCYSSGTSGLPKGVMISHRNVMANTVQVALFESVGREKRHGKKFKEVILGLLPMSHIYGLVVISHVSIYQGDEVIVLPKFEIKSFLEAVQRFKMTKLYLVPPIVIALVNNKPVLDKYNLSSVASIFCGAAPLGAEVIEKLAEYYPSWNFIQGYGLTETCTVVTSTSSMDIWPGSVGSILPGFEVKLVSIEGHEVTGYDQPGELWARSPSVALGYLHNEEANRETFIDGYMRTGDEAVRRKGPNGHDHYFITDRIKELIKVKGMQVAPAELEAHLLAHPAIADCAVISIPDDRAGERPKAYVVKSSQSGGIEDSEQLLVRDIKKFVEKSKAQHKWLAEIEFIDVIPKSPSGKILRRHLRDKDRASRRKSGPKL